MTLMILLSDNSVCSEYVPMCLNAEDMYRVQAAPHLEQRMDWQVSRFLKQQVHVPILSVSHSNAYAAVLASRHQIIAGVDIEKMRMRNFLALAEWVCSIDEIMFLQQQCSRRLPESFYRLWCIKEALLKSSGKSFPDDMKKVGYCFDKKRNIIGLRVDDNINSWHGLSALVQNKWAMAVVWRGEGIMLEWQYYGQLNTDSVSHIWYW